MKKRVVAAILWFYAAWVAWSLVASLTGLPDLAGPVFGTIVAAVIAGDPMHRIWPRPAERPAISSRAVPARAR